MKKKELKQQINFQEAFMESQRQGIAQLQVEKKTLQAEVERQRKLLAEQEELMRTNFETIEKHTRVIEVLVKDENGDYDVYTGRNFVFTAKAIKLATFVKQLQPLT